MFVSIWSYLSCVKQKGLADQLTIQTKQTNRKEKETNTQNYQNRPKMSSSELQRSDVVASQPDHHRPIDQSESFKKQRRKCSRWLFGPVEAWSKRTYVPEV